MATSETVSQERDHTPKKAYGLVAAGHPSHAGKPGLQQAIALGVHSKQVRANLVPVIAERGAHYLPAYKPLPTDEGCPKVLPAIVARHPSPGELPSPVGRGAQICVDEVIARGILIEDRLAIAGSWSVSASIRIRCRLIGTGSSRSAIFGRISRVRPAGHADGTYVVTKTSTPAVALAVFREKWLCGAFAQYTQKIGFDEFEPVRCSYE